MQFCDGNTFYVLRKLFAPGKNSEIPANKVRYSTQKKIIERYVKDESWS